VTTLRGIPFRIKLDELPLPLDLCAKHNLVQETVFRQGPEAPGLKDVVLEVATRANDHLNTARQYIDDAREKNSDILRPAFCIFLPAVFPTEIPSNYRLHPGSIYPGLRKSTLIPSYGNQEIGSCHTECGRHSGQRGCSMISQYTRYNSPTIAYHHLRALNVRELQVCC
jgi:hypothetical protein